MKRKFFLKPAKRSKGVFLFISLAFLIFFTACQKNKINEDSLVRIYVENIIIEESHSPNSEEYKKQKAELFKKYNTTQKDFEAAMLDMKDDKDKWELFFKKADALVDDLKKSGTLK